MATSANVLSLIIDEMLSSKPADRAAALELLAAKGYLPKKLAEVPKSMKPKSIFASKAAEDFADANSIVVPEGFKGTANGDKISVKDLKILAAPPKTTVNASPSALQFCRDNNLDVSKITGTGAEGKVLLKDVKDLAPEEPEESKEEETLVPEEPEPPKFKISPGAAKLLKTHGIDEQDVIDGGITGTGKDGTITAKDIKPLLELANKEDKEEDKEEDKADSDSDLF